MAVHFYNHPQTGVLHFHASAGGGDGSSSIFDAPATTQQIDQYGLEYKQYLRLKENGSAELDSRPIFDIEGTKLYIADLEKQVSDKTAQIEQLNARIAELEGR